MTKKTDEETGRFRPPVLARLVHSVLDRERFDSIADLAAAVKAEAGRLRIPYDAGRLSTALDAVSRTRPLLGGQVRQQQRQERAAAEQRTMSTADARRILERIADRLLP